MRVRAFLNSLSSSSCESGQNPIAGDFFMSTTPGQPQSSIEPRFSAKSMLTCLDDMMALCPCSHTSVVSKNRLDRVACAKHSKTVCICATCIQPLQVGTCAQNKQVIAHSPACPRELMLVELRGASAHKCKRRLHRRPCKKPTAPCRMMSTAGELLSARFVPAHLSCPEMIRACRLQNGDTSPRGEPLPVDGCAARSASCAPTTPNGLLSRSPVVKMAWKPEVLGRSTTSVPVTL